MSEIRKKAAYILAVICIIAILALVCVLDSVPIDRLWRVELAIAGLILLGAGGGLLLHGRGRGK